MEMGEFSKSEIEEAFLEYRRRGCGEALGGGGRVSGASRARRRLPPLGFPRPEASRSIVFVTARVPYSIRRASWLHRGLVVSRVDGPPPPRGRPRADPGGGFPRRRLGRARGDAGDARARARAAEGLRFPQRQARRTRCG